MTFVFYFLSQAGQMTQIGVVEHLKLENVTLSHQLTETQHRSIKDKERIAVQLQSIEVCFPTSLSNAVIRFVCPLRKQHIHEGVHYSVKIKAEFPELLKCIAVLDVCFLTVP